MPNNPTDICIQFDEDNGGVHHGYAACFIPKAQFTARRMNILAVERNRHIDEDRMRYRAVP